MSKQSVRRAKHLHHFYEHEIAALAPVLTRLGLDIGDLTEAECRRLLSLVYSLPHEHRADPRKVLAGIVIAIQALSTIFRHEIHVHSHDPEFRRLVELFVGGDPTAEGLNARRGLFGSAEDMLRQVRGH